jgi:subfamily B ATP-binding cassette protein MsbA
MKTYLRILAYGRAQRRYGILSIFFLLLQNIFGVFSIALTIPFLQIIFGTEEASDVIAGAATKTDPNLKERAYVALAEITQQHGGYTVLIAFCLVLAASIFLKSLFRYLTTFFMSPFEQGVVNQVRNKLFDHLSRMSMPFFTGNRKGQVVNVMVTDTMIVQESVVGTVQTVLSEPVSVLLTLATLFLLSWKLTLFTLIVLPVTGIFIRYISKSLKRKARSGQERMGLLISTLDEFITGIRIVKSFVTERHEQQKYERLNRQYSGYMVSLKRRSDLASPLTEVIAIFVVITIILYGGNLILNQGSDELAPSTFIGFVALFGTLIAPIKAFSNALSRIQKGMASFQRIEEFLAIEEIVKEDPNPLPMAAFENEIRYEDVRFAYAAEEVLGGVSFTLRKGHTVALVGPSGGGKSTLADLLSRFHDPTGGRITIDGVDIRKLKVNDLRGSIGMVTQEGVLFNDTIIANIAYGDAKPDLARVREAARVAFAADFIEAMPEQYRTVIGERGGKLSGGQRQRLAIARAVYKNAPILVLDEATSALDSESEKWVQQALESLRNNRTSLVIAHRLSTILNADLILVIDKGKVVEQGTHDMLLKMGGLYKKLYQLQFADDQKLSN